MNDFPASMRVNHINIEESLTNYSDFIFPDDVSAHDEDAFFKTVVAIFVIILALFGILANIFVLILSFYHVTGDFSNFVANLAVVDILCAIVFAFMGFINVEQNKKLFPLRMMTYWAFAFHGSCGLMVCALVPISLSRVIALKKSYLSSWLFSGRRPLDVCLLFDIVPIAILFLTITLYNEHARWLYFTYAGLTVLSYIVAFLSNYIVFRTVARHIRVIQNLRDHVRLLETRQIALATFAQAIVPLICQVPAFLTLSSIILLTDPMMNGTVTAITQLGLAANPLLDALITVTVIKQYRRETVAYVSSLGRSACGLRKSSSAFDETKIVLETKP